ncbi:alpha/beta fold hydrolase [Naasia aerilata]|uniref:Hydrolase n=1 Tax=Naasia aerilata TaxID=1162966 RepID=A0ABM8G924_9MICO|nr:alpha/beta hydrolase [Naasia aerilata]BDZ44694.1 hydrolase [Naasia aerilata]
MTLSHIRTEGGRVAVELTGEGPLVVCMPGMGDLRSAYRFLVPALVEAGYRVAAVDLRGHGDSDDDFASFDDEAAARDLLAVVQELGGPAILVGSSMAAGAAVIAAAARPELVSALVLLGPFVRDPSGSRALGLLMRLALLRPWGPAVWRSYYRSLLPGTKPADYAEQERAMLASVRRHWRSFVHTTRTTHAPAEAALPRVTAPALVVMGSADGDWKDPAAEAAWIGEQLRADVLVVDGVGHYPMVQAPDQVNPAVLEFARRVAASA